MDIMPRYRPQLMELQVAAANQLHALDTAAKLQAVQEASIAVKQLAESATASGQDDDKDYVNNTLATLSALSTALDECKGSQVPDDDTIKVPLTETMACLGQML
eukprot:9711206-Heterocapsa_arctica.AAC.1